MAALVAPLCLTATSDARAAKILAIEPFFDTLLRVEETTAAATPIGPLNATGLAYDFSTGTLFAADSDELFTVNLGSGEATLVGATGFVGTRALAFAPDGRLFGTAFDAGEQLIGINPFTGAGTAIGTIAFPSLPNSGSGIIEDLAFSRDGRLFAVDQFGNLLVVDTTTADASLVGTFAGGGVGLGLAFLGETLFATEFQGSDLLILDPNTGTQTSVVGVMDLPYGDLTVIPLPAPVLLLATALGSLGLLGWRRRRTASA